MVDETQILDYFAIQLVERMRNRGIKLWYMAYYCEIEECALRKCLKGERLPNPWNLILMAEVLNCTINDLLGYEYFRKDDKPQAGSIFQGQKQIVQHVSNEILERMGRMNISYDELANRVGVSVYTIKAWLSQNADSFYKKSTFTILRICDALDCTPSDILGY